MRNMIGGGFTEAIRFTWNKYKRQIKLMEQDILNIIFEKSPKYLSNFANWEIFSNIEFFRYLFELPCEWNYHAFQCRPDKTENPPITRQRNGVNLCPNALLVKFSVHIVD